VALDLAYLPKSVAEKIEFHEDSIYKLIAELRRHYVEDDQNETNNDDASRSQIVNA